MTLNDIQKVFNRAFWLSFSRKRLTFVFIVLSLCGLLVVFCRGLAFQASEWMVMSLTFLPIFLCTGILLSTGVVVIRTYYDEVKKRPVSFRNVFKRSWELIIGTSYLAIPMLLGYLLLWVVLGIFYLLKEIPAFGQFIGAIFSFGPFILILGSLTLVFGNLLLLFFVTPAIGLQNHVDRFQAAQVILKRIKFDIFGNLLLLLVAIVPLLFVVGMLVLAAVLTGVSYTISNHPLYIVLEWFFIMLPFTVLLSPAVTFFFNFAAEAHVLMQKHLRDASL